MLGYKVSHYSSALIRSQSSLLSRERCDGIYSHETVLISVSNSKAMTGSKPTKKQEVLILEPLPHLSRQLHFTIWEKPPKYGISSVRPVISLDQTSQRPKGTEPVNLFEWTCIPRLSKVMKDVHTGIPPSIVFGFNRKSTCSARHVSTAKAFKDCPRESNEKILKLSHNVWRQRNKHLDNSFG